ncbi:zinc ribbon domain-containing protein [Desulfobacterales bacterium HSG16]|nr:zinc ribbon domain-containing protein [Desulfobacterales bacterium HSG16]
MPIYEFKCSKCEEFFELLFISGSDDADMKCPKCDSEAFERVLSSTNYAMGAASGNGQSSGASTQTRKCSGGSCTTYNIPGPD